MGLVKRGGRAIERPSVVTPVSTAIAWTRHVLFEPFDLGKWFTLGFCAWLAWIGQHGRSPGFSWRQYSPDVGEAERWAREHWPLIVAIAVAALMVIVALVLLLTWLSSRGKLMFLDGVVRDRGAVVEPWRRYRELGNSLFAFRVVLGLIVFAASAVLFGTMIATWLVLDADLPELELRPLVGILGLFGLALVPLAVLVLAALAGVVINDVVVPIQWLRGCRAMPAWKEALSLVSRYPGTFFRYFLMKLALAICVVVLSCCAVCLTCCIAALPYIGTVILLPLYVFGRSYSMHFLAQFGPEYAPLATGATALPAAPGTGPVPAGGLPG